MNRLTLNSRVILCVLFLLAGAVPAATNAPAGSVAQPTSPDSIDLRAFQLVTPSSGWALLGPQLYWTDSGGDSWTDITPLNLGSALVGAAAFADKQHGWLATTTEGAAGDTRYALARTSDGGQTWQNLSLSLFAPGDAAALAGDVFLQFIDTRTGWLVVKRATSSNFSLGTLFKTADGGDTWTRLSLPVGAPVHFDTALEGVVQRDTSGAERYATHDGGATWTQQAAPSAPAAGNPASNALSAISMASPDAGWAESRQGACRAGACVLTTQLVRTADGGRTWAPVRLPGGRPSIQQSFAAPSGTGSEPSDGGLRLKYDGQGFDSCKNDGTLPLLDDMQNWYVNGPYQVWNLYIGGSSRARCGTLLPGYLQQLAQQGWLFIPTWVGPQAPCTTYLNRMSADQATAQGQGVSEADRAISVAQILGLTLPDGSGTVVYYDVEYYQGDQACRDVVKAFISGWSGELRALGNQAGVYGAPCGPSLSDFANIPNVPDMVWPAVWHFSGYTPGVSVWNLPCLSNTLWKQAQRLRQYAGGHSETWGGVTYNIDSDVITATLSTVVGGCTPGATQAALFVYPNFGGQCVLRDLGEYPTIASLGLPQNSISSVRLGSQVTVQLCQAEFYGGTCQIITADSSNLANEAVGDNVVSSARVSILASLLKEHLYFPWIASAAVPAIPAPR